MLPASVNCVRGPIMAGWFENVAKRSAQRAGTDIHDRSSGPDLAATPGRRRKCCSSHRLDRPDADGFQRGSGGCVCLPRGHLHLRHRPRHRRVLPQRAAVRSDRWSRGHAELHERARRDLRKRGQWSVPSGALQRQRRMSRTSATAVAIRTSAAARGRSATATPTAPRPRESPSSALRPTPRAALPATAGAPVPRTPGARTPRGECSSATHRRASAQSTALRITTASRAETAKTLASRTASASTRATF